MIGRQFLRYVVIGLLLNAAFYAAYLLLTWRGAPPRWAMTATYCGGVCVGFALNRRITFQHDGPRLPLFLRYAAAYALGYVVNLVAILVLEDRAGLAHQWVQAAMVFALAIMLFLLQKFWVFAPRPTDGRPRMTGAV
jgi:putative flippase GtrA